MYHILLTERWVDDNTAKDILSLGLRSIVQHAPATIYAKPEEYQDIIVRLDFVLESPPLPELPFYFKVYEILPNLTDIEGNELPYSCTIFSPRIAIAHAMDQSDLIGNPMVSLTTLLQGEFTKLLPEWSQSSIVEQVLAAALAVTLLHNDEVGLIASSGASMAGVNAITFIAVGSTFMDTLVRSYRAEVGQSPKLTLIDGGLKNA